MRRSTPWSSPRPTHLHEAHVAAALSANLHVLVEKPLTINAASAQRIVRAAEKRDRS